MLFNEIVYGPIHSRRLGVSLGINLMPTDCKLCTFNCIYCECGWNTPVNHPILPTSEQVRHALLTALNKLTQQNVTPDVITFSGNGEPTLHPQFETIVTDTCALRDQLCPDAKVTVLSNSTQLFRADVVRALRMVDNRILKLDSAIDKTMRLIDQPVNTELTVGNIKQMLKQFNHDFTLQTCFLKGQVGDLTIDNTTPEELTEYYKLVKELAPKDIMIYVIDRKTPCSTLQKIEPQQMQEIANCLRKMGFNVSVSA
ncbi:MAG: radical SAM protein [Paludibacteraceae bacterium]|nr:radical SAM protein [Paludibacteraceae bacterium]